MNKKVFILIIFSHLVLPSIFAQEDTRLALVIGNADYGGESKLEYPVKDARSVSDTLTEIGWNVTSVENADRSQFLNSVIDFKENAKKNENPNVLFYFAGHTVQIDSTNYLIPINTSFDTVNDIVIDAVSFNDIVDIINDIEADNSMIVLDSSQNSMYEQFVVHNPSDMLGLAFPPFLYGKKGSAVIYSMSPGLYTIGGREQKAGFSKSLISHLNSIEPIEAIFSKVTQEVALNSLNRQIPWFYSNISEDFFFVSDEILSIRRESIKRQEEEKIADLISHAEENVKLETEEKYNIQIQSLEAEILEQQKQNLDLSQKIKNSTELIETSKQLANEALILAEEAKELAGQISQAKEAEKKAGESLDGAERAEKVLDGEQITYDFFDTYVAVEGLGGNFVSLGLGAALFHHKLDIKLLGGFALYDTPDESTFSYSLGAEITHHIIPDFSRFNLYYGGFFRYNSFQNTELTNIQETFWLGITSGVEYHLNRFTFYIDGLIFSDNFVLDWPDISFRAGVKFWI